MEAKEREVHYNNMLSKMKQYLDIRIVADMEIEEKDILHIFRKYKASELGDDSYPDYVFFENGLMPN